jgi:CIC family chloride channel protein
MSRLSKKLEQLNKWRMQRVSNRNFIIILAFLVGIVGGIAASLLKAMTHSIASFLQDDIDWQYKYSLYLIFPLIGILLSVIYLRKFLRGKKFEHGITPIIYAISRKSSRIETHNVYSQIITSALTVGFGGSSGLEAPIAHSGAAIGSNIGRFFGLSYKEMTMLLACGASAGISGAFNSPLAGMIFSIEILLTEFSIPVLIPLLIASALAAVVSKILYDEPLFYTTVTDWDVNALLFYLLLAVIVGIYTIYFSKLSQAVKKWAGSITNPYMKVWVSGVSLGVLIFIFPALYGEGYLTIQQILNGHFDAIVKNSLFSDFRNIGWVIVCYTTLTLFAKSLAALITVNSGGQWWSFWSKSSNGWTSGLCFCIWY